MSNAKPRFEANQPCGIVVRKDLSVMVFAGDETLEIQLAPRAALELAASLLNTGLEVAERNAAARTGAAAAIADAQAQSAEEPNGTQASPTAH